MLILIPDKWIKSRNLAEQFQGWEIYEAVRKSWKEDVRTSFVEFSYAGRVKKVYVDANFIDIFKYYWESLSELSKSIFYFFFHNG